MGGDRDRARSQFPQPRVASWRCGRVFDSPRAWDCVHHNGNCGNRSAACLTRRPHHRPRPPGRRWHDHDRDYGNETRGRLRQGARGDLRLYVDRLPDADWHAGNNRRFRANRLRA